MLKRIFIAIILPGSISIKRGFLGSQYADNLMHVITVNQKGNHFLIGIVLQNPTCYLTTLLFKLALNHVQVVLIYIHLLLFLDDRYGRTDEHCSSDT